MKKAQKDLQRLPQNLLIMHTEKANLHTRRLPDPPAVTRLKGKILVLYPPPESEFKKQQAQGRLQGV